MHFNLDGRKYPFPTDLTFDEMRAMKRASGGMSIVELEEGLAKTDIDAFMAYLSVSIAREEGKSVIQSFTDLGAQVFSSLELVTDMEVAADPPAEAAADEPVAAAPRDPSAQA